MDQPRLLQPARFAGAVDGRAVALYTLRNSRGMAVSITSYGAKIEQLIVPGGDGRTTDVVLGYESLEDALAGSASMGAFIGRYAGRIGNAAFTLDGKTFHLSANNGPHCLHGGTRGSRFRVFEAIQRDSASVEMNYVFADGEEGFPGALALRLLYSVTEGNELVIEHEATALDQPTVASFASHAFFNLNGASAGDVTDHEITIHAGQYLGMTDELVATGEIMPVAGTALDFREPALLAARMRAGREGTTPQVKGYDNCYLVQPSQPAAGRLALAASVRAPASGRVMEVWSTEPALQFYTGLEAGQALAGGPGKEGVRYLQQHSFCFEPQGYPNAPNCPSFPSAVHVPGQSRSATTVYRFAGG